MLTVCCSEFRWCEHSRFLARESDVLAASPRTAAPAECGHASTTAAHGSAYAAHGPYAASTADDAAADASHAGTKCLSAFCPVRSRGLVGFSKK